ncbi:hypothetical protein [Blastococcus capsensis]|nr:hypothetical protein [Blastococcus capsensis]MDK3257935.1 hypothetical protein [Blastococcus capsensis]
MDVDSGTEKGLRGADVRTTDLDGREDDVPEPPYDPPVCSSGELRTEGGG